MMPIAVIHGHWNQEWSRLASVTIISNRLAIPEHVGSARLKGTVSGGITSARHTVMTFSGLKTMAVSGHSELLMPLDQQAKRSYWTVNGNRSRLPWSIEVAATQWRQEKHVGKPGDSLRQVGHFLSNNNWIEAITAIIITKTKRQRAHSLRD